MSATRKFLLERPNIFARALLYLLVIIAISTVIILWFATIKISVQGSGIITFEEEIHEIYSPYEGIQENIHVKRGQFVKKNDVLATLKVDTQYHSIISPIDGVVAFAKSWDDDVPLKDDEAAFVVVPTSNNFVAKIEVLSSQMKNIEQGQIVNLKIDAYPYRNYGVWESKITYISATTKLNEQGEKVYEIIANISKEDIENKEGKLVAGQSLKAEIIVQRKKILLYLVQFIVGSVRY